VRVVLARSTTSDAADYDFEKVRQFADDIDELKNTDGIESLLDDIANKRGNFDGTFDTKSFNSVKGSMFEARVGGEIGADSIDRLNLDYPRSDSSNTGDIDILRTTDGQAVIIDAKAGTGSPRTLEAQLDEYLRLRGKTIDGDVAIPKDARIRFVVQSRDAFLSDTNPPFVNDKLRAFIERLKNMNGASFETIEDV
jgi:hypothetical protein